MEKSFPCSLVVPIFTSDAIDKIPPTRQDRIETPRKIFLVSIELADINKP
jgi:hypothetical protein